MDPKQPLWLPRGSVRAIIALILVVATVAFVGVTLSWGVDAVPAPLAALFPVTAVVINSYFEKRASAT